MLGVGLTNLQVVPPLPFQISTRTKSNNSLHSRTRGTRGRHQKLHDSGICHASFFKTLFSGSQSGSGSSREQANELVNELLEIIVRNKRNKKPYIGTDDRIEEIATELKSLNVTRNPVRNPLLFEDYEVGFAAQSIAPPVGFNLRVSFSESFDVVQECDVMNFGVFPGVYRLYSTLRITASSSYSLDYTRNERDNGLFGGIEVREMEDKSTRSFDIVHLDDCVLVAFAEANDPTEGQVLLVLIKKGTPPAPKIEESIKSEISIGRAAAVKSRRASVATLAERNYKKQMGINESQAKAPSAGREARWVAARSQKEQAEAKREATLKLKSEIKESVDEFGRRLKEAQTNKKDAATALKNFERENSEALKQANIFRKRLENFEMEATGLANEIVMMADREKQSAAELKDYRRQLADLERKLTAV